MAFELKAEYAWQTLLMWHIVPAGNRTALCGQWLPASTPTCPITDLPSLRHRGDVCVGCTVAHMNGS
ncbi:hypothetical protein [Streptacidiphilus melanogenes]|uniref:hypothetical protein n=1 Tax=Streptacidiphilus melanogenes TaxID=411235 RepID=UPI0005A8EE4B|nr:hypothetical protein [Streptacidiphilus melanogenes]